MYRTKTYIAADWDYDKDAVDKLYQWKNGEKWNLDFHDAHEITQSRDTSLPCSIKASLKLRMDASKTFVLIVGSHTNTITKGSCRFCSSYNSYGCYCARGRSIDYRSFIEFECQKALEAGIKIVVLYNSTKVDKYKCPACIRNYGEHIPMCVNVAGQIYWNYYAVKRAFVA